MLKKLLLLVVLACLAGYSYSEGVLPYYGQTGNAASNGLIWNMDDVLPSPPGLDINAVIYNYTIRKQTQDSVDVTIQNERASGQGYIFRETDNWLPGSLDGTQINKTVPVTPTNRSEWGDGSIVVDGPGSVENPRVVYSYRVDPCFDPQLSPLCPGYKVQVPNIAQFEYELYDATEDARKEQHEDVYEEEEEEEEVEEDDSEERDIRREKALASAKENGLFASAFAQNMLLQSLNDQMNMNNYYTANIQGGVYKENVVLNDKRIPDNKRGLRNGFAQQLLHEKMIQMQYE